MSGQAAFSVANSDRITRLSPGDLFSLHYIRGACLSPDARWMTYAVSLTEESERFEIWIADLRSGERRKLAFDGNANTPSWSPDGRHIAFLGNNRLHLAAFPALTISGPLTPQSAKVEGRPSWSPDSRRIVVSLSEHVVADGPLRIVGDVYRADGVGFLGQLTQCIYEVVIADGTLRCLAANEGFCSQPQWSPCGRRILFLSRDSVVPFATESQRLLCIETHDGTITEVLGRNWYVECARWVPGGARIAVAASRDSGLTIPVPALWVIDSCSHDAELRTPGVVGHAGFRLNHDMPARDLTANHGLVVLDAESAFVTVQKGGCAEIWRVALEGEPLSTPVLQGPRACLVLDIDQQAEALLYAVTDLQAPWELGLLSLRDHCETRLTALNDAVLAGWPRSTVESFRFTSADGLEIEAWFMSPADRQRPLPTVLFIHAGPFVATGHAFRYDFHLLASQGYGVLFANFRGSAGYGEPFVRAVMGDWGGRAYPDHMGAVDAAITRGYADPERLGVWGPSHGGFATCWIVGHTNRFRAAVAEAASTNFTTLYYLTDVPDIYRRDLGGRPHEIPDVYRSRSPITYAHRCTTPTMLVHGEDDLRCPISEAEQFYRALKDVGCPTELFRIPSCSHIGDSIGPLSARRAQNEALVSWFNRHL